MFFVVLEQRRRSYASSGTEAVGYEALEKPPLPFAGGAGHSPAADGLRREPAQSAGRRPSRAALDRMGDYVVTKSRPARSRRSLLISSTASRLF
jgi:hypothetical protein